MAKQLLLKIKDKLGDKVEEIKEHSPKRAYITVRKEDVPEACRYFFNELKARFMIASGIDNVDSLEILYHFAFEDVNKVISIRTFLKKESPEIDSVAYIIKGAEWIEREIHELLGIDFKGHPDLRPLLMAEDWPKGKYPLRRDFVP